MQNESACCKTKENHCQRRATSVLSARCRDSLECISDLWSDGELLDEGMHVWANLTSSRHSERREGVGIGERASILIFLPLDCVGEVFSYMACYITQIGAGAKVDDGNVE